MIIEIIIAFLSGILTDIIWALYIYYVSRDGKRNRKLAAAFSIGTGICTLIVMYIALTNFWITSFWLLGLGIGTYYAKPIEIFIVQKFLKWSEKKLR